MQRLSMAVAGLVLRGCTAAHAQPESAYTRLNADKDCRVVAEVQPGEGGDWQSLTCKGYKDYPVYLDYGDLRESVFYGFAPGDKPEKWESFGAFNHTTDKIEWRTDGGKPFATIHRWILTVQLDNGDSGEQQILVVEKVGQPDDRTGCTVAWVMATGNPGHNEQAREIGDTKARDFRCGIDRIIVKQGKVPAPVPPEPGAE